MHDMIPHTAHSLDDIRVEVARRALAELPDASDNEEPYFWIGRLRAALEALAVGWPSGVPGGLSAEHREVLGQVLADAIDYRDLRVNSGQCRDCEARPDGLCCDHAADLDLTDAYLHLAAELGVEVAR